MDNTHSDGHGAERTVAWVTEAGRQVTLGLRVRYELDAQGRERAAGRLEISTTVAVDGQHDPSGLTVRPITGHPVAVARIGRIGLTREHYAAYRSTYDALAAMMAAHNAACDDHAASMDAVEDDRLAIEAVRTA